jgi:hypothetical protein
MIITTFSIQSPNSVSTNVVGRPVYAGAPIYVTTETGAVTYVTANEMGPVIPASNRTVDKIRSFSNLPNGWHFGAGHAPSFDMIAKALAWHDKLLRLGFVTTDAFPGMGGEIMVTGYEGPHYIEILLEADSTITLAYEKNGIEAQTLSGERADKISAALEAIAGGIWNTSGYFTQSISTANAMSSKVWPSKSMWTVPPSSKLPALDFEPISVTMSENFIPMSEANRPFFGFLTNASFPKIAA